MQKTPFDYDQRPSLGWSLLVILCNVIAVFIAAYFVDFLNLIEYKKAAKERQHRLQSAVLESVQQQSLLEESIEPLPQLKLLLHSWQKKLVNPVNISELQNQIVKMGHANQLVFRQIKTMDDQSEGKYSRVPVFLVAKGHYADIARFISQIANLPWIVVIDHFSIYKNKQLALTKKGGEWEMSIDKPLVVELTVEMYHLARI